MKKFTKLIFVSFFIFLALGITTISVWAENNTPELTKEENDAIQNGRAKAQEKVKEAQAKLKDAEARAEVEKAKIKAKNLNGAKQKASKEIDNAIRKLTKIKERVTNMPTIAGDLKTQLNSKIDEWIVKLSTRKAAVNAATTKDELKTAMDGFKSDIKEAKKVIQDIVEAIHKTHLQKIIARVETFIPKVETKVAGISDTSKKSEAMDLVNDAKAQIANAKTLNGTGKIEEARKAIKTAYRDLKNALEIVSEGGASNE